MKQPLSSAYRQKESNINFTVKLADHGILGLRLLIILLKGSFCHIKGTRNGLGIASALAVTALALVIETLAASLLSLGGICAGNNDLSVRLLAGGMGGNALDLGNSGVNDASFVGVHRLKSGRASCAENGL